MEQVLVPSLVAAWPAWAVILIVVVWSAQEVLDRWIASTTGVGGSGVGSPS